MLRWYLSRTSHFFSDWLWPCWGLQHLQVYNFFKFLEISNPRTSHFFSDWLWPYCDRFFNFRLFLYSRRKSSGDATRSSEWSQAAKIRFPVFTLSVIRITHHKCYYVISFSYFFFFLKKNPAYSHHQ